MMNGNLRDLSKSEKREFLSAVNDAILNQKYRIVIRRIFKKYTSNDPYHLIKEYAVQKRKKFLFFYWWDFCDKNEHGLTNWSCNLEDCEKYIYDKYVGTGIEPTYKILGLVPSE